MPVTAISPPRCWAAASTPPAQTHGAPQTPGAFRCVGRSGRAGVVRRGAPSSDDGAADLDQGDQARECLAQHGELTSCLARVRADGWESSRGEYVPNVAGVSAAVLDSDTGQIFGIGVALPAPELHDGNAASFGRAVRDAALRVGKRIGDPYWLRYVETEVVAEAPSVQEGGRERRPPPHPASEPAR
ncbi:IclR family transcriptional regulator C-terminal domain-containing protein [Streptomyces sp. NPDC058548]|uniref:IclR family transcriptional regulator domain-containing protein n=1 Tax=unclassified Streptomyces TaxID=2593676 RepID=UPI00366404BA